MDFGTITFPKRGLHWPLRGRQRAWITAATSLSGRTGPSARHTSVERGLPGVLKVVGDHTDKSDGQRYRRVP